MLNDLSVAGPGSPVSLEKFRKTLDPGQPKDFMVLIDSEGIGFEHDDKSLSYITTEECSTQALYYSKEVFDGRRIPMYLYRYLAYMFLDQELVKTDLEMAEKFKDGTITEDSPDYIYIRNLITYCEKNVESKQLIGLIQLFAGSLNMAFKEKKPVKIFLEHPDSFMHPRRTARLMSMFHKIQNQYYPGK